MPAAALSGVFAAFALAAPAPAATGPAVRPIGAPEVVRLARAGDEHQRPRALTEWWELVALDPRTGRSLRVRIARGHRVEGVELIARSLNRSMRLGHLPDTSRPRSVTATGAEGTTTLRRDGRGWRLAIDDRQASGSLRLTRARRGPTGLGWRLGETTYLRPRRERVTLNWSSLAATSRVTGALTLEGRRLQLDGWLGSLEHVWGRFMVEDPAWSHLSGFVVHRRGGGAAIAFGLNRTDTMTGPGARDAQWLGVLARVGRRGARICRPAVHRRRWTYEGIPWHDYARTLRARCGGMRITFSAPGRDAFYGAQGIGHYEYAWPARATGGGRGVAVFIGRRAF
jgi:hypothetical protein